jgi:hypothetical protein
MTKARWDGLYLVLLGSAVFLLLGVALEIASSHPGSDFRFVFTSARCLFQDVDPYKRADFLRVYLADGGDLGAKSIRGQYLEMSQRIYFPTSFVVAPFALLPWGLSLVLWTGTIAASFIAACLVIWDCGANQAPILSGFMVSEILVNSILLIVVGNAAGVVIGLCVLAAWCFIKERFVPAGTLCLAIGLMLKPHDAGLVWLYFLLAGGIYRKRAVQTLLVTAALSVPMVLWVTYVAPSWLPELRSNLAVLASHGNLNDPGPVSMGSHGIEMVTDLQTAISFFRDDPGFYNPISYLISGSLLLVWAVTTLRSRPSISKTWFALAAVSALSMLPVYHRLGDAKLLLLTVPACSLLWAKGGFVRWLALGVNTTALLLTGDLSWAIFFSLLSHLPFAPTWLSGKPLMALQVFPVPLILLIVGIFYLWAYVRLDHEPTSNAAF